MIKLFFSYSHVDEAMRNELEIHLTMLKRSGLIDSWHDRRIIAGKDLDSEISQHLEEADVILLLLSPHFLASDYCYESEAQRALERNDTGTAVVIPVILQPCDWLSSPFCKLRATPKDGKPVAKFPNINDAFLEVTQDIRAAAESLHKEQRQTSISSVATARSDPGIRSSNLRIQKTFTDRDRDAFIDESYAYIEKFFENSLSELKLRNPATEFRFKRISTTGFTAAVYVGGAKRTSCHIWLGGRMSFGGDISFAANDSETTNSVNDGVRVENDGFNLGLKPSGLSMISSQSEGLLTPQGAAEYFWSAFISPLQ
jgi:hypothetical protein